LLEAVVCTLVLGVKFEASRLRPRQSFVFVAVSATALCFGLYRRAWAATSSAGAATRFQISAYALGRIRDRAAHVGRRPRSFVAQVMKAAAKANGGPLTPVRSRGMSHSSHGSTRTRKGRCSRIGRGQAVADQLKLAAGQRGPHQRMRRVVVKARIVRLKIGSRAALAHLTYLQRDGTTRDGGRGQLYGPDGDQMDGRALMERSQGDRHQFRFIVAPEDGDRLADLRGFTRDVMRQMEQDLCTRLDWVAVDHFNTGHPHSHVVVRGRDDVDKDLIIAQDYITDGLRLRVQERATLELGPETDQELRT
jgi:hypothetical protein